MPQRKDQPDDPKLIAGYNDKLSFETIGQMLEPPRSAEAVRVRLNELRKRGLVGYRHDCRIADASRRAAAERQIPALSFFGAAA